MAYTKTEWKEMKAAVKNKFNKSEESAASVRLTQAFEGITQAGTPFSVENMNKIEQGIFEAHNEIANLPYGYLISFPFQPTTYELATWGCFQLAGQLAQISLYQRLCNRMYVGDAANATAPWWYKCDSAGNRAVNGAYMRVLDAKGLFIRAAGQNGAYKMANDAPYDGGSIGAFIEDRIQKIYGHLLSFSSVDRPAGQTPNITDGPFYHAGISNIFTSSRWNGSGSGSWSVYVDLFDSSRTVRSGNETKPASISSYLCVKY
jgi:hypothetical protein